MTAFADAYGEAHLPRRHSGVFLQRTRSALSIGRRPDVNTSFGVGGHEHGRAGARMAGASSGADASGGGSDHASQTDLQADFWASGPFSALEAWNRARARVRRVVPPLAGLGLGYSGTRTPSAIEGYRVAVRCVVVQHGQRHLQCRTGQQQRRYQRQRYQFAQHPAQLTALPPRASAPTTRGAPGADARRDR